MDLGRLHVDGPFPYSEPLQSKGANYLRNPIKVVIDAYNGDTTFYQIDPDDGVANAWGNVFPGLFTPGDQMPDDIRRHLRYPEDFLVHNPRCFPSLT